MQSLSFPELILFQWVMNFARYTVVAGGAWLVFWKWLYPKWKARRLYKNDPTREQIRREIGLSALTMTVFLLPLSIAILGVKAGFSRIYLRPDEYGWTWYGLSYVVLFLWHDTYFYWTHRLMHWGPIYRVVHRTHHLSRHPTPFTAFAFHPLEALIEGLAIVSFTFVVPVHVGVTAIFTLFSLVYNVYGHLGIRLFSHERGLARLFTSSETHAAHHEKFVGNYGFYLRFWDRAMGTEIRPKPPKEDVGESPSGVRVPTAAPLDRP